MTYSIQKDNKTVIRKINLWTSPNPLKDVHSILDLKLRPMVIKLPLITVIGYTLSISLNYGM